MDVKVVIVEDEVHTGAMLRNMIAELRPAWDVLAMLQSVKDTVAWLSSNPHPEIIFMDIELADGSCFEIFNEIEVESGIVFTTAYHEHALRAFQLNSIHYLLKPIKKDELEQAIVKFEKILELIQPEEHVAIDYHTLAQEITNSQLSYRRRILVSKRGAFFSLPMDDVAYIYVDTKVTFVVAFDGKQYPISQSLDKLEPELDPALFFRANRQAIVNLNAIEKFEAYFNGKLVLHLKNQLGEKIIVSRDKAMALKSWMNG
ncbi:MAG TPA: LytTR family DNA-binding domain-containing protein [Williamwhitmania sp.]|nr:LytTR family DNA-binding domain-containing protein [Williamwhitmania sp.]